MGAVCVCVSVCLSICVCLCVRLIVPFFCTALIAATSFLSNPTALFLLPPLPSFPTPTSPPPSFSFSFSSSPLQSVPPFSPFPSTLPPPIHSPISIIISRLSSALQFINLKLERGRNDNGTSHSESVLFSFSISSSDFLSFFLLRSVFSMLEHSFILVILLYELVL